MPHRKWQQGWTGHGGSLRPARDAALEALVAGTVADLGRIDGLVNNAGANFAKPFLDTTEEDWEWVISLDLRVVFFLTQRVCRQMLSQGDGGSVVNISSVHSQSCLPGAGPYDAAKWGVVGIGKSMAVELAPQDLQSAAPSPKACLDYWKQNISIGRVIEPEEIGELAAFLLCDRSASITGRERSNPRRRNPLPNRRGPGLLSTEQPIKKRYLSS